MAVHPTAVVDPKAEVGVGVEIGAYSVVGAEVQIGDGSSIGPHSVLEGPTRIGERNRISSFASIGSPPQDLKYGGEPTRLEIGNDNVIREFASINRGTVGGGGVTRVGSNVLLMAYSHVAHDCCVGDGVVLANAGTLAGHVSVDDYAIIGGLVAVHQYVRIGSSAILAGGAMVSLDIPPFCLAAGDRASLRGLNVVGLQRRGFSNGQIKELREAYRILFQSSLRLEEALVRLADEHGGSAEVAALADFIKASERGICRP